MTGYTVYYMTGCGHIMRGLLFLGTYSHIQDLPNFSTDASPVIASHFPVQTFSCPQFSITLAVYEYNFDKYLLSGEHARDLFLHSRLPLMVLSKIW